MTWFKRTDVAHYITQYVLPGAEVDLRQAIRILDFKEGVELAFVSGRFSTLGPIAHG